MTRQTQPGPGPPRRRRVRRHVTTTGRVEPGVLSQEGGRPAGYPLAYERWLRLRDGRTVHVRPILPSDAPELAEAIRTADATTLQRRFLGVPPRPTPKLLAWLTTVDYVRRFALVAFDPVTGRGIAVARFEPSGETGVAEVAVAVDPAWRRAGLATGLVELLAEAALERGVHSFGASYLAQNRPVDAMLAHAGSGARHLVAQGVAELAVALDDEATRRGRRSPAPGPDRTGFPPERQADDHDGGDAPRADGQHGGGGHGP